MRRGFFSSTEILPSMCACIVASETSSTTVPTIISMLPRTSWTWAVLTQSQVTETIRCFSSDSTVSIPVTRPPASATASTRCCVARGWAGTLTRRVTV